VAAIQAGLSQRDSRRAQRGADAKAAAQAAAEPVVAPVSVEGEIDLSKIDIPIDIAAVEADTANLRKAARIRKAPVKAE
jgi:small subunit ribosomal protein S2